MSGLLWFRRDIRIQDNPALVAALNARVKTAVFISTPVQWKKHHYSPIKIDLLERHLRQLSGQLKAYGIKLIHLHASDFTDQLTVLEDFCTTNHINRVFANRELEVDEVNRDSQCAVFKFDLRLFDCEMIVPPDRVLTKKNSAFRVFSAYRKVWLQQVQQFGIECSPFPASQQVHHNVISPVPSQSDLRFNYPKIDSSQWPLSDNVTKRQWNTFVRDHLPHYGLQRDFPAVNMTSRLSPYLAIGAISPRWLVHQLILETPDVLYDQSHASFSWLNELIWRDFYKYLIVHFPRLVKGDSFLSHYQKLPWLNHRKDFQAWCEGRTGYPLVDAAMKQLLTTGWMHNRLRMVVASFLTKHLLIDWRWGERFFMSQLIDGDFSANNGGWQWAASTGCDAQPYFRVFNPILQSQKFDPNGDFIRMYIPELNDVPNKYIHFPHEYLARNECSNSYWPALVDHKNARLRAIEFFRQYRE